MSNPIEIEIVGSDYTKLTEATFTVLNKEQIDEKVIEDNKLAILITFLDKMSKNGVVNTAVGLSKKDNKPKELWTSFGETPYFDGVVGVMQGEIYAIVDYDEGIKLFSSKQKYNETIERDSDYLTLKIRLQIKSRFDTEKPYFLATMLLRNNLKLNDNMVMSSQDDLYDYLLLFWFKTKLEEAVSKGFFKAYRRFEMNNDRLKGAIDVSRHIRLNAGQNNGKIAYSYRENTINNYLNHLIIAAYDYLKKKFPELVEDNFDSEPDMKASIDGLRCAIGYDPIESKMLIAKNNKPISHPYFMEYEDLRLICIMILRDEGISIWDAEDDKTKTILFYIPDLWELYLEDVLKEKFRNDVYTQGKLPNRETLNIFGNFTDSNFTDKGVEFTKKIYPDFVFFDGNEPYMVLDAKFKKGWGNSILNGKESTIYDLPDYDKCIRDMNSMNVHSTGILFPFNQTDLKEKNENNQNEKVNFEENYFEENRIIHKISEYNQQDRFYTLPVYVPETDKNTNYTDWKNMFDGSVDNVLNEIEKYAGDEKKYMQKIREYMRNCPKRERIEG